VGLARVVAIVGEGPAEAGHYVQQFGDTDLDEVVHRLGVSEIVVAADSLAPDVVQGLIRLQERGVAVVPMATEYEQVLMRVPVSYLPDGWMFTSLSEWVRARDASNTLKRIVDIAGSVLGAVVLTILLPCVAIAILADSGAPVFYVSGR
jgi:hypothetical protein